MLGDLWIGPSDQNAIITVMGAGSPNFLAVDHPFIAVLDRPSTQARKVTATMRFGKQLAPNFFPAG